MAHDDTLQTRLDKLDALLARTSTPKQDAALFAEMLSLPNDGRYPALDLTLRAAQARNAGSTRFPDGSVGTPKSGADDLRGCALDRPHQPGSVRSGRGSDRDPSRAADRDVSVRVRAALDRTASRDCPHPQSANTARNRRHDRPRRRQQAASGGDPSRHRRAHRRHSPVRGGDDQGGAGGGK